ncbi:hypothetical protein LCGC14_1843920 [marine sediment metagenome]|uniref:Uncharacterized protein n=1 Tax=marine sediment metagenome TaxID=412755 RepID=A0A0F9GCK4_9ZZZZ
MKLDVGYIILLATIIMLILVMIFAGGCSLFQMSGADKIALLPETPQQQLFQTIAKTNWLFTLSVVGVGAGFFAFLNGSSKGLQFMAACFVVISLIIGLTRYSAWIAAIAMIGTVCLMIYSVLVKNRAMREVIQGIQDVRDGGAVTDKNITTWKVDTLLNEVQSKTTKAIVKIVKDKL